MTPMNRHCEKFQRLLRELFQFDCADLDFGIYRIMNYKRGAVEKFIAEDLPNAVAEELTSGNLADQARAAGDLTETARRYLVYRGRIDRRRAAVIWRETEGWGKADLDRDKKFVAEQKLAEGADEVFVNGDSFIPNVKALEPLFKARMFAGAAA